MIKHLFTFCLLLYISSLSAQAQKTYHIGLKGGLSIPNLTAGETKNDWNKDYTSRIGPHFAAYVEIPLSKYFSLVPELAFAGQGGKRNTVQPMTIPAEYLTLFQNAFKTDKDYIFANLSNVSRINFLQLPVHLKYQRPIALKGKLSVHIQAGPYIGYMVSGKQIVKSDSLRVFIDAVGTQEIPQTLVSQFFGNSVDTTIDAKKDLYHWNAGVSGTLGLSYALKKGKITLEGGGNYGFFDLQKGNAHGKNKIGAGLVVLGYAHSITCHKKS